MKNEQQGQNLLLRVDSGFTFCNTFPQQARKDQQTFLLRDKLMMQSEKRETSNQNKQRNNVARHAEGFCIHRLTLVWVAGRPIVCYGCRLF